MVSTAPALSDVAPLAVSEFSATAPLKAMLPAVTVRSWPPFAWPLRKRYGAGGVSTCAMVALGLLRLLSVDDPDIADGYADDIASGLGVAIRFARRCGAWQTPRPGLRPDVGDVVQMLQYSTYSVISPEGCASILWKTADKAPEAAEQLGLTAQRLKALGLIDKIVAEPTGGAHRDYDTMMSSMRKALTESLKTFDGMKVDALLERRHERLMSYGKFKEITAKS